MQRDNNETELDGLEAQAFEAWREDDESLGGDAFVERVMGADSVPISLVLLPADAPHDVDSARPRGLLRWAVMAVVAGSVAAGGIAAVGIRRAELSIPAVVPVPAASSDVPVAQTPPTPNLQASARPELPIDGAPGTALPADLEPQIKAYIAQYGSHWGPSFQFHGVVAVARGGRVEYARGFGVARPQTGTPNGPGTRFRLGMLTEQFTAALILRLRDEGKLSLDDDLARYVPELSGVRGVTLAHLLAHRSGLPDYTTDPSFASWKSLPQSVDTMLARWADLHPTFEPGSAFSPSNTGYYLLGVVIERVTGDAFADNLERQIFEPLGMRASGVGDAYDTGEQAVGNVWAGDDRLAEPAPLAMSAFGGAAAVVSSALDLVRWDHALHRGDVLGHASVDAMVSDHGDGYGYGFALSEGYGQRVASFPAIIDGFSGAMVRFLDDETLVVVLSNNEVIPSMRVAQDVAAIVYGNAPVGRREYHEVEVAPGTLPRYVGIYTSAAAAHSTAGLDLRMWEGGGVSVGQHGERLYVDGMPDGRRWLHPMGHHEFFFKDHSGTTVTFEIGGDKNATRMVVRGPRGELALDRE